MLMKRMLQFPVMAVFLVTSLFVSCKKDDDGPKSNTEKLALAPWKYDKVMVDQDNNGTGDVPGDTQVEDCDKDNLITFKANGTGNIDAGADKCDPQDPQQTAFTWTFKNNETIINFPTAIVEGVDGDVKLISLTESSMVVSKSIDFPPFGSISIILTLKH
ncbi:MAG: hypothetical protein EOO04_29900 [Chitinophagaceae bacterium]|nr:MAG: hypothetical protein EOO04_29900 [Chitinophagaceae bacterium]